MNNAANNWIADQHQQLAATLKEWSNINSGSYHVAGVERMADAIQEYIESRFEVSGKRFALPALQQVSNTGQLIERPVGPLLKFSVRPEAETRILLCGHMDTVFPEDSEFQQWHQIDANTLGGPGVADMKGGIIVMLTALQAYERHVDNKNLGWDIVLNPDEEVGSIGSAPHLIDAAQNTHMGMVFEPSMPDGWLAGARRGSGNYSLVVHGKAAHAGREYHAGRNSVAALAQAMTKLDSLNALSDEITLNLARISGGGPNNIVPDLAICHFNIRVGSLEDQALAEQHVASVLSDLENLEGYSVELHGGFTRPPKPATSQQEKLFELVRSCSSELDIEIGFRATGGCCDGNNLLAAGLPNIDTLGVRGGDIHSDQEYMHLDSLSERSKLSFSILEKLNQNASFWLS